MSALQITFQPTVKQDLAWQYLTDQTTREILFGGGAGGAKSYLGCAWLIKNCLHYAGSRWLMGRAILKNLKESTLLTFFEVAAHWGLVQGRDFIYYEQKGYIEFANGSRIYLKDLFLYPSDPNFDSLGSTEYTGAFVDEANQISAKARSVLRSRLRYRLEQFNLIPKILYTCNPAKTWVYTDFYLPWRQGTLPERRAFIQALVTDNPHVSPHYIEELQQLDPSSKERLLFGNWEYDDDPNALFARDDLTDLFSNVVPDEGELYLTCDVARLGRDKTVYAIWRGLRLIELVSVAKTRIPEVIADIEGLRAKYGIPMSHVLVDEDGVGGGVVDGLGCKGFVGGSSPLEDKLRDEHTFRLNYANLRCQCYYTLAEYVREHKLAIDTTDQRDAIIADLEQVKAKDPDRDTKLRVIAKDTIKEHLGRSPDFGDAVMMRMYFALEPAPLEVGFWSV